MEELELRVPEGMTDYRERCRFAEMAREKLRRLHNAKAAERLSGKLSEEEWERFLREEFEPRNAAVTGALLSLRGEIKADARATPDSDAEMAAVDLEACFSSASAEA